MKHSQLNLTTRIHRKNKQGVNKRLIRIVAAAITTGVSPAGEIYEELLSSNIVREPAECSRFVSTGHDLISAHLLIRNVSGLQPPHMQEEL